VRASGRGAIASTLAIVIAAAPAWAAADETPSALERLVARWRTLDAAEPGRLAVLRALAARPATPALAPSPSEPGADADSDGDGVPATARGRAWPTAVAAGPAADTASSPAGLRLAVPPASVVRAPAAGRVVFADHVDGLGLVLITAHGDEYHSVLAGLGRVDVAVGTRVGAGETIGRTAERTESDLDLHLELRHHGRPVDPLPWLGVNSAGDGPS
jgi:murein DD-endopeptidase MepM/ murein hydrolase activator NlpD